MTKTEALRIARSRCGSVHRVAASRSSGVTYGFNLSVDRGTTTVTCGGDYREARRERAAYVAEMAQEMLAPAYTAEEMNAAFADA